MIRVTEMNYEVKVVIVLGTLHLTHTYKSHQVMPRGEGSITALHHPNSTLRAPPR